MRKCSDDSRVTTTPSASAGTKAASIAADAGGNDLPRDDRAEPGTNKILFARPDLTAVWRQVRDYIVRYKLLRLTQSTEEDGIRRQTICNLWRIEHHKQHWAGWANKNGGSRMVPATTASSRISATGKLPWY